ncbi:MAG: RNA polymerase sigma factor [Pyrinomonadaceae bacterium]
MITGTVRTQLSHEEIFLGHYDRLLKWALQITRSDRELAEDIVHDAFVQFMHSRQNFVAIKSIDKYLYVVLRNSHLSHLRRAAPQRHEQLSHTNYSSAESKFLVVDPRRSMQIQDKLLTICRYACLRKETSISGSVLILKYFHGYFPSEAAQLVRSSRNAVYVWLESARREAQDFLINPDAFVSADQNTYSRPKPGADAQSAPDIFTELRREIFAARRGECVRPEHLFEIYRTGEATLTRATLSHIVSCPHCLDEANKLLGLSPLRERHPLDVLERSSDSGFPITPAPTRFSS